MVTATTVVCWIFGIGGLFCFGASMNMPQLYAGQYMILSLMFVLAALYFNIKYKEIARERSFRRVLLHNDALKAERTFTKPTE